MGTFINKVGKIGYNNCGNKMEIIRFTKNSDMDVKFYHKINGEEITYIRKNTSYTAFESGQLKSPYDITIRSFGYIGEGDYSRSIKDSETGKIILTQEFTVYEKMLINCEKDKSRVSKLWINFQEFARWYNENKYECNDSLNLARLSKSIVSPSTCILIPHSLYLQYITLKRDVGKEKFLQDLEEWEDIIL